MDTKDLIATCAIAATVVGWLVAQRNSRENERRKARLELINRQLSELYAPMYISCVAGRTAHDALMSKLNRSPDSELFEKNSMPSKIDVDEWMLWMEHVFMPLNTIREKIVLEKFHLLLREDREQALSVSQDLLEHVCWCRAMVAKWKRDKDNPNFAAIDLYAPVEFPRDIEKPLSNSVAALQKQQAELLDALKPNTSGLTTLGILSQRP
jgi:hypothetical protein